MHLLRGLAVGLYSLTAFFAVLVFALEPLGIAPAFALALLASLAAQAAVFTAIDRSARTLSWARGSR